MKSIFRIITIVLTFALTVPCYAKKSDDITLIVTNDGATKDEAIKNSLRTAIEQAYGVFVSANTDILDDELVKDEIVTVSSGNIKKFEEIALVSRPDKVITTLKVTVSKGKLLSYAKSKGSECELDGEAMFADIQLQELYKENEEKLLENLCEEFMNLLMDGYDYKLDVKRAVKSRSDMMLFGSGRDSENNVSFECDIYAKLNEKGELAWNKLLTALKEVGRAHNPDKISSINPFKLYGNEKETASSEFAYEVLIPKPTRFYNGHSWDGDRFLLRSPKSIMLLENLIGIIPYLVKNVSLEYAGKQINICKELKFLNENLSDGTLVRLNATRPYSRKKGSNCGEYRYILNVPKEELKDVRGINIKPNGKLVEVSTYNMTLVKLQSDDVSGGYFFTK